MMLDGFARGLVLQAHRHGADDFVADDDVHPGLTGQRTQNQGQIVGLKVERPRSIRAKRVRAPASVSVEPTASGATCPPAPDAAPLGRERLREPEEVRSARGIGAGVTADGARRRRRRASAPEREHARWPREQSAEDAEEWAEFNHKDVSGWGLEMNWLKGRRARCRPAKSANSFSSFNSLFREIWPFANVTSPNPVVSPAFNSPARSRDKLMS